MVCKILLGSLCKSKNCGYCICINTHYWLSIFKLLLLSSYLFTGYESGVIRASEFRTYHTPLNKQVWRPLFVFYFSECKCVEHAAFFLFDCHFPQGDYVNSLRAAREFSTRVSSSLKVCI